jgi:hypothetical protein
MNIYEIHFRPSNWKTKTASIIVGFFCAFSYCQDPFSLSVSIEDPAVNVTSDGMTGKGRTRGSDKVSIKWNSDLDPEPFNLSLTGPKGSLPLFKHLFVVQKEPLLLLALGWSTSWGFDVYTAWLVQLDQFPHIVDALEITQRHFFPAIQYDSTSGGIALMTWGDSKLGCPQDPEEGLSISSSQGIQRNPCKKALKVSSQAALAWKPYEPYHVEGKAKKHGVPKILGLVRPSNKGFRFSEK